MPKNQAGKKEVLRIRHLLGAGTTKEHAPVLRRAYTLHGKKTVDNAIKYRIQREELWI